VKTVTYIKALTYGNKIKLLEGGRKQVKTVKGE
jgi:hypothetical protein